MGPERRFCHGPLRATPMTLRYAPRRGRCAVWAGIDGEATRSFRQSGSVGAGRATGPFTRLIVPITFRDELHYNNSFV